MQKIKRNTFYDSNRRNFYILNWLLNFIIEKKNLLTSKFIKSKLFSIEIQYKSILLRLFVLTDLFVSLFLLTLLPLDFLGKLIVPL